MYHNPFTTLELPCLHRHTENNQTLTDRPDRITSVDGMSKVNTAQCDVSREEKVRKETEATRD